MALRRDRKDDATWLTLPSELRDVPAPEWPLEGCSDREKQLWERLWREPVAAIWERDHQSHQVAMYVRTFAEAEKPDVTAARRTLVRQMAGELLLTIPAMLSARVRIAQDEVAQQRVTKAAPAKAKRPSARDRMKVASGGGRR